MVKRYEVEVKTNKRNKFRFDDSDEHPCYLHHVGYASTLRGAKSYISKIKQYSFAEDEPSHIYIWDLFPDGNEDSDPVIVFEKEIEGVKI